jgi:hypothetical protein
LSFSVIRVKRSTTGISGAYGLITANTPAPATLTAPEHGTYDVAGKTLQLLVDHEPQFNILFTGLAPLTTSQVVGQINLAVGETVAADVANYLKMTSTHNGTISRIEIVGGSAAPVFGWADGTRDIGEDANVTMMSGISNYSYIDQDGQAGYFYKAQFYNPTTLLESNDSAPFEGDVSTLVDADNLSLVKVDLVDARGISVPDQEISFYPEHELLSVQNLQVALNRAPITIKTNNSGHAEVSLVRGLKVRVVFEGTGVIRSIIIPDSPETNLLEVMATSPDPFSISMLPYPIAPRRTI